MLFAASESDQSLKAVIAGEFFAIGQLLYELCRYAVIYCRTNALLDEMHLV